LSFNEFLDRKARNSLGTSHVYRVAVTLWGSANNMNVDELVNLIKDGKLDVYESLDRFVSYLVRGSTC